MKRLPAVCCLLLAARAGGAELPGSGGRLVAGGYLDGLAVVKTEDSPRQRPQALLALTLDGAGPRWLSAHLELRSRIGGPFEGGHPGVYNLVHAFQNRSPALEASEAYADVRTSRVDLRLGVQKVAWGKLDGIPPTDVVNPRDYHDPLVQEYEERKIGVPAVLGTYYPPDLPRLDLSSLRATLIYVPFAVPSRLALKEERWFPRSVTPPAQVVLPKELVSRAFGLPVLEDLVVPVSFETLNHRPPRRLDAGGVGFRLGGSWRRSDWDLYHYTGPETGPNADLRAVLRLRSSTPLVVRAASVLRQAHDAIHMTGGDWATTLGGATLRAEAAVFIGRPYLRDARDLIDLGQLPLKAIGGQLLTRGRAAVPLGDLFVDLDAVEWGVGADYLVRGFMPLVQLNQIVLLEPAPRLLISDPETRFAASVRKRALGERLELELRGVYALERQSWFVFPRVSYHLRDDLRLRLAYLAIGGPRASLIGQFRSNDEVVFQVRFSF